MVQKWQNDNPKSMRIDNKLLKTICPNLEPLSFTEKSSLDEAFEEANPRFFEIFVIFNL
jgi:hypothetical protein